MPPTATGVSSWLSSLSQRHVLTRKEQSVADSLAAHPRLGSYGSIREVAEKSNVSIGTVTRASKSLGFMGWPALQEELRAIYISSLSAAEIAEHRSHGQDRPAYAWLTRDRDNINSFMKACDLEQLRRCAQLIQKSRRAFVVGLGSYNGVGYALAHSAWLHGYDVRLLSEEMQVVNTIAQLGPDDLVIIMSFWRLYEVTFQTIRACNEQSVPIILLSENLTHDIEEQCTEVIRVPSEAVGFQTSLSTVVSVVQAIIAELIALDPDRAKDAIARTEKRWEQFGLLRSY